MDVLIAVKVITTSVPVRLFAPSRDRVPYAFASTNNSVLIVPSTYSSIISPDNDDVPTVDKVPAVIKVVTVSPLR